MSLTPILECRHLDISYFTKAGEIPAVHDFNLKIMPGQSMGLVGESGCGKSTVALAIMNYLGKNGRVVGGEILFKGQDLTKMSRQELVKLRGKGVAMIYQEPMASLNPSMTIGKQLMEVPIFHRQATKSQAYDECVVMLNKVRLPDVKRLMKAFPHEISGGQQQRVVIALALLAEPDLLLLDEPTTALDVTVEAGIISLIKDLAQEQGTSLIYISHNLGLILDTCDYITVMYSGEAVETGSVQQVFTTIRHPYTRGLFNAIPLPMADKNTRPLRPIEGQLPLPHQRPQGCTFGPRCEFYKDICQHKKIPMQEVEPDHYSRCLRTRDINWEKDFDIDKNKATECENRLVLDVKNLQKYYPISVGALRSKKRVVKANEDISFTAYEGQTIAIVGESGCGKSTFAKILMGLEEATNGDVILNGQNIANTHVKSRDASLVSQLQMVFQNPFDTLNPSQTIGFQLMRVLRKFSIGANNIERKDYMYKLLDEVKLPRAFAKRLPRQLSGGQKQRVGIARAFAGKPATVIADEPVSALDVSVQAAITGLLMDIQREHHTTLLFISHDLSLVRYISDKVIVMYLGHVVEKGLTSDIFSPPYHPYTEALLCAIPIADATITKKRVVLEGDIPSAVSPPSGCPFHTRCPYKIGKICETEMPALRYFGDENHQIACHLDDNILNTMEAILQ